ncbi:MAG: DnaJ domain-containing protein [Verrucomicrobia bacterium]|nr:DnaJ domain-containing protein [Verrucomicrobiota bacterium]
MPVQFKDYYATLGIAKTASQDEVKKAFRQMARKFHPDVAKDKKTAENKFKEINEAYEVLGDPEKRKRFDELGSDWDRQGRAPAGGARGRRGGGMSEGTNPGEFGEAGFSDFFEHFFSARDQKPSSPFGSPFRPPGGAPGGRGRASGEDTTLELMISIEEALRGEKKKISFRSGSEKVPEVFEVRIPKGVKEGQKIRLAGHGQPGVMGGPPGDLLLVVRFSKHPDYRTEGTDLFYDLIVPPWLAVLGGEQTISTPDGAVLLKIPAGSQSGKRFRLKGRGMPMGEGMRGDFYAALGIALRAESGEKA